MAPTKGWVRLRLPAALLALGMVVAACGDDEEDAGVSPATTQEASGSGTEDTTTTAGDTAADGASEAFCAAAADLEASEDFPPPADLIRAAQEAAPEEIREATEVGGAPFVDHEGDPVALFAAMAEDDVELALNEVEAFEASECGLEDGGTPVVNDPEEGATVVEVTANDYAFAIPAGITAGRTSFVLTNDGQEAHFLALSKIAEGHTLDEALAYEGDPEEAGLVEEVDGGETGLAAPGGSDIEVATVDLEPGTYAAVCFVAAADGTPHVFMGMAQEFTVS